MSNIIHLLSACPVPPPNPRHMRGPKPRGIVYLPAYRRDLARKRAAQENPAVAFQRELACRTPAQQAEGLLLTAYDLVSRAREILGRPPLPPIPGPGASA